MFVVPTKTIYIEALKATFDAEYVEEDFRNIWVSLEYPALEANYPGIWVDFAPTADLQIAGIAHTEWSAAGTSGERRKVTRWRFAGMVTFTLVALTSLERDRLIDELTRVMAFGMEDRITADFRNFIEQNDLIGLQVQWDKYAITGHAETPGTPWGTDDVIYEATVAVDCQGEFVSDGTQRSFVPLSSIIISHKIDGEPDEAFVPPLSEPYDATSWH